jgi:hypothetical protein
MNKGDFVGQCLPYYFKRDGDNCYVVLTAEQADNQDPGPPAVCLIFPQELLETLQREHMVKSEGILLYDESTYPSDSDANMKRYLDILRQLAKVQILP